jgi:hypothetical protein
MAQTWLERAQVAERREAAPAGDRLPEVVPEISHGTWDGTWDGTSDPTLGPDRSDPDGQDPGRHGEPNGDTTR